MDVLRLQTIEARLHLGHFIALLLMGSTGIDEGRQVSTRLDSAKIM